MATKQIIDQIRMGDRVTFTNRMGKSQTGKAVMYGPGGWVLNMGGAHGTPAVVKEWEITKVVRPKGSKSTLGTARLSGVRNPASDKPMVGDLVYFMDVRSASGRGEATLMEKLPGGVWRAARPNGQMVRVTSRLLQGFVKKSPLRKNPDWGKSSNDPKYVFKIAGLPKDTEYNRLPFGRQIEYRHAIEAFKKRATHAYLDTKRISTAEGLRRFKKLYKPTEYFLVDRTTPMRKDDSTEIWYVD